MGRLPKWLRRTLFVLLLLVLAYVAAGIWIGAVGNSRVADEIEAIRARGEPLTLAEMAPPPVPDERNAAALLLQAKRAYVEPEEDADWWTVRERFAEAPFEASPEDAAAVAEWIEANQESLTLLEEALARPSCRFDFDYASPLDVSDSWFPAVMDGGHLLVARAYLAARDGRIEDAYRDALRVFRLGTLAGAEPTLISFLVRVASRDRALDALRTLRRRARVPAEISGEWIAALDSVGVAAEFRRAMLGERCFGHWVFEHVRTGEVDRDQWGIPDFLSISLPEGVFRLDQAWYLSRMAAAIAISGRPWHEAKADWDAYQAETDDSPWYSIVSSLTLIAFPNIARTTEEHRARLDLARLALTADRAGSGGLPPPPEGTERGTTDPFTGEPYLFEKTEDGFTIRSAGPEEGDPEGRLVWD